MIRTVRWFTGPKRWGKEFKHLSVKFDWSCLVVVERLDSITAVLKGGDYSEGATAAIRELGDRAGSGGALDLYGADNDIIDLEGAKYTTGIGSVCCLKTTVFGEVAKNVDREDGVSLAETEEFVEIVDLNIVWWDVGDDG